MTEQPPATDFGADDAGLEPTEAEVEAALRAAEDEAFGARIVEAMRAQDTQRQGWGRAVLVLAFTALLFVATGLLSVAPEELAALVGVIFFHELGHYLGMLAFGYSNVRMFFIPFLGAAVTGRKPHVEGWKAALVSLLGPLPGIVLGAGLAVWEFYEPQPLVRQAAFFLLALNAFNLLPIFPLDGGQFWLHVLFVRSPRSEALFKALTGAALAWAGYAAGAYLIAGIGVFVALSARRAYRLGVLAQDLQSVRGAAEEYPRPAQAAALARAFLAAFEGHPLRAPKDLAVQVRGLWERLHARPPGLTAGLALGGAYAATLMLSLAAGAFFLLGGVYGWRAEMDAGREAYVAGRYEESRAAFEFAAHLAERMPAEPIARADAQRGLGKALFKLERYAEAEAHLREALQAFELEAAGEAPLLRLLYAELAEAIGAQGRAEEASEWWAKAGVEEP